MSLAMSLAMSLTMLVIRQVAPRNAAFLSRPWRGGRRGGTASNPRDPVERKAAIPMYEDVLAQVPLFRNLPSRDIKALAAVARERQFTPGERLLTEGESGAGLYVLIGGKVRVTQRNANGEEVELGTYDAGAVLGEMSLLDDLPRSATVTAIEPTRALVIPVWDFRSELRNSPDMAIKLLEVMSHRLRSRG